MSEQNDQDEAEQKAYEKELREELRKAAEKKLNETQQHKGGRKKP